MSADWDFEPDPNYEPRDLNAWRGSGGRIVDDPEDDENPGVSILYREDYL